MSSWKKQITSGFSLLAEGVDGMLAAGTDKVLHGLEVAADKAVDLAERANEKLDQLAARLLESVEAEQIVRKQDLLAFVRREDNDFTVNLAGRLWNRLVESGFQSRMARVDCVLRDAEGGFYVSDLGKLVTTLKRSDIDIIQIGDRTVDLLEAFVASR